MLLRACGKSASSISEILIDSACRMAQQQWAMTHEVCLRTTCHFVSEAGRDTAGAVIPILLSVSVYQLRNIAQIHLEPHSASRCGFKVKWEDKLTAVLPQNVALSELPHVFKHAFSPVGWVPVGVNPAGRVSKQGGFHWINVVLVSRLS